MDRIRTQADVDAHAEALMTLDTRLVSVVASVREDGSIPLRWSPEGFEGLVLVVTGQQVSKAAASAIFERTRALVDVLDGPSFLRLDREALRAAGQSNAKIDTLRRIAEADLDYHALADLPTGEAVARLTAIKGVGPWTAEVWLLFSAGHPDIFPVGDLALRVAVGDIAGEPRPDEKRARALTDGWSPYRSVAARIAWAHYARMKGWTATPV